jgi:3,4-dihydroxy 2-butanone 4-phosphate synthase/GTP cyclohydrolase II
MTDPATLAGPEAGGEETEAAARALAAIAAGRPVIVVDDDDRENEGDLILAAERASAEAIAFVLRHTSGILCVSMLGERLDELRLPPMVFRNTESLGTAFTISVDHRPTTTTGVSASDRAATIAALIDPAVNPDDFGRPGHVFPLRYREGGVLIRPGHTEAAVDLARMAGMYPAGVLCEVQNPDGSMARMPELQRLAAEHDLPILSIAELVAERRRREGLLALISQARMPTAYGTFTAHAFESRLDGEHHIALTMGDVQTGEPVLCRVHSECLTGDIFGSMRCDCGPQLQLALERIAAEGRGIVVYLKGHEGRGVGLTHKLRAYELQDNGHDTVDAQTELGLPVDSRDYGTGAEILNALGVSRLRLMTNNPSKYSGLASYGVEIVERIPLLTTPNEENITYLRTKQNRLGHLLGVEADAPLEPGAAENVSGA